MPELTGWVADWPGARNRSPPDATKETKSEEEVDPVLLIAYSTPSAALDHNMTHPAHTSSWNRATLVSPLA